MNSAAIASDTERQAAFAFPLSPFAADCVIEHAAVTAGFSVRRRPEIEIDPDLLPASYLRKTPDYSLIRKHLEAGIAIPGAGLTYRIQYVLAPEREA